MHAQIFKVKIDNNTAWGLETGSRVVCTQTFINFTSRWFSNIYARKKTTLEKERRFGVVMTPLSRSK